MSFKQRREAAGLTVLNAAKVLGVSDAAIYMWETGQMLPKTSRLKEIAEAYGCTIDELLREEEV